MNVFAEASSVELSGAAPYLFQAVSIHLRTVSIKLRHRHGEQQKQDSPSNHRHSQESTDAADHQRNNAFSREAGRQRVHHFVLALKIQDVNRVTRGISGYGDTAGAAHFEVIFWDCQGLL